MPSLITPKRPMYELIRMDLLRKIGEGVYPVGTALPGRTLLARAYGVSYGTVDRALVNLGEAGFVKTESGRGTFVARVPENGVVEPADRPSMPQARLRAGETGGEIRLKKASRIGIVARLDPNVLSYWDQILLRAAEGAVSEAGGVVSLHDRYRPNRQGESFMEETLDQLEEAGAEGMLILAPAAPPELAEIVLDRAMRSGLPAVYVSSEALRFPIPHVYWDSLSAGYQAGQHLLAAGYRRLAYLGLFSPEQTQTAGAERINGVRQAVARFGQGASFKLLRPDPGATRPTGRLWEKQVGRQLLDRLLNGLGEPVPGTPAERLGIVAYNDTMAIGVLEALEERGLVLGREVGLIGFDDQLVSQTAGLSTVRPPLEEMALTAVRLLVEAINGEQKHSRIGCLPQVIVRRSTRRD